jgi:hypothetical protein
VDGAVAQQSFACSERIFEKAGLEFSATDAVCSHPVMAGFDSWRGTRSIFFNPDFSFKNVHFFIL